MATVYKTQDAPAWKESEKSIFRFFFLFFLLQSLPLSIDFFRTFFSIDWVHLEYGDIFNLTRFYPRFLPGEDSFVNWLVVGLVALAGSLYWKSTGALNGVYDALYYWIRALVRYRLAIGVIGYGFIKLFPLQAPFPSLSNLNTSYGDFNEWKLFSLSLGVVPWYESFLGVVELLAGFLLLIRRTATFGAIIVLIFTGNVFLSNLGYSGGETVYSFYLVSLAAFVFWFDAKRIYSLVALERFTAPNTFVPAFNGKLKPARRVLKSLVLFFFVVLYGFKTGSDYKKNPYQFPTTKGLPNSSGVYNVSKFTINGKERPYSPTDPVRWRDVVFEKWATISIRSNAPVVIDATNYERVSKSDPERNYELAGSGGRRYYSYSVDSIRRQLTLRNKNVQEKADSLVLNFVRPNDSVIVLSGRNHRRDSIYAELTRLPKKYLLLNKGRQRSVKL